MSAEGRWRTEAWREYYRRWSRVAYREARRERAEVVKRLGGACNYCGCVSDLTLDRIEPGMMWQEMRDKVGGWRVRWGKVYKGLAEAGGVQVLCRHCNSVKGRRAGYMPPLVKKWRTRCLEAEAERDRWRWIAKGKEEVG